MRFIKMTGLGNDYVYVDCFDQTVEHPARLAQIVSNRNFGIGSDGLILVLPPDEGIDAAARMQMFNMDGSEGQMCGNGIRCVCKMVFDHQLGEKFSESNPMKHTDRLRASSHLTYETEDAHGKVKTVSVDMGRPLLDARGCAGHRRRRADARPSSRRRSRSPCPARPSVSTRPLSRWATPTP